MTQHKPFHDEIASLTTEQRNPASMDIDASSVPEILRLINAEDKLVPIAVEKELPYIIRGVDLVVDALRRGGRLLYVGAGSSGRLGVLDAVECPPTFGTSPDLISGMIAGGEAAMFRAQEGAEDNAAQAITDIDRWRPTERDVVCGIAASRRTPYVVAAVARARSLGAHTMYVTANPRSDFDLEVDVAICPDVGPEVIMGSTRMKSGTAEKMILNMITTAAMIRLGKVYENMMIDLQLTNRKLVERAHRIVMIATGVTRERAERVLDEAGGHVKTALVMLGADVGAPEARKRLEKAGGFVRQAIGR